MGLGALLILSGVCGLTRVAALHEDQAGTFDWHQSYLGTVTHAEFSGGSSRKRVFVGTAEGSVAALTLRTGEIAWRQVLEPEDTLEGMVTLAHKSALVTISGHGRYLRAWGQADGMLLWDASQYNPATPPMEGGSDLLRMGRDFDGDDAEDLATLGNGLLQLRSSYDGTQLFKANLTAAVEETVNDGTAFGKLAFDDGSDHIVAVGVRRERDAFVFQDVGLEAGKPAAAPRVAAAPIALAASMQVVATGAARYVVGLSADGAAVVVADVSKRAAAKATALSVLFPGVAATATAVTSVGAPGVVGLVLADGAKAALLTVGDDGTVSAAIAPAEGAVTNAVVLVNPKASAKDAQTVAAIVTTHGSGASVKVVNVATGAVVLEEAVPALALAAAGGAARAFLSAFLKKDGVFGFRAAVVGRDAAVALTQQGEVVWRREEALGAVLEAHFVDLPPVESTPIDSVEQMLANLQGSLEKQLLNFKVQMKLATPEERDRAKALRTSHGEKLEMAWDSQGFRKLLVVRTAAGKMLALHNGDGRVVWSTMLGGAGAPPPQLALVARLPPGDNVAPEVLAVGAGARPGTSRAVTLDAWKGTVLRDEELPFEVAQVVTTKAVDKSGRKVLLLIDTALKAHLMPATAEAAALLAEDVGSVYFYQVHRETDTLAGYKFTATDPRATTFDAVQLWENTFPETIMAFAQRGAEDHVHSRTRILGDRSTLYKYLNPNTLFVVTSPEPVPGVEPHVTAIVMDTVSGKVLYRVRHQGASGPVSAVFSENWLVYHYWNVHAHRNEVSVLEVFDGDAARRAPGLVEAVVETAIGNTQTEPLSSLSLPVVRVLGQSYFFSLGVKAMAVTATHKGITSKNILLGTTTDQVLAMEKRFLDPRRPTKPTAMDKEEGLIPYNPNLPIIPHHVITTRHQVAGLRGILASPSRLESTSLVFSYGLDLFYTRVMPSKMYDTLDDHEFSYALLLVTLASLVVGTAAASVVVSSKELKAKWV